MRFVVRQKIWTIGDDFVIKDEFGKKHFIVKGKIFSLGNKLRLYTMDGRELYYIEQKLFRFLPEYNIYYQGRPIATVKKEFTLFKPKFNISSIMGDYSIDGNFLGMEFSILKSGVPVAQVSKRWFAWSDTYGVDISDDEDYAFILALVIIIDQVLHDNNKNNS